MKQPAYNDRQRSHNDNLSETALELLEICLAEGKNLVKTTGGCHSNRTEREEGRKEEEDDDNFDWWFLSIF